MATTPVVRKSSDAPWEATHFQMVFFPTVSPREVRQNWFRDLTGVSPKESASQPHEIVCVGQSGEMMLTLTVDLLRVAFGVQPLVKPDDASPLQTISSSPEAAAKSFLTLMSRWTKKQSLTIKRIGFSGRLIQRAKKLDAAYRMLKTHLPALKLDSHSRDFIYRINRPRKSRAGIRELEINRLATWAVIRGQRQVMVVSGSEASTPAKTADFTACVLEFDVNTSGEFSRELPKNRLPSVMQELASLAFEIAKKGDVR
jgi:hypothetical protein